MLPSRSLFLVVVFSVLVGCSDSTNPPPTTQPTTSKPVVYHYQYLAEHSRFLGPTGKYIAWFKFTGDSTYSVKLPMLAFFYGYPDSMKFEGDVTLPHSIDSLQNVLISVEPDTSAAVPTSPITSGMWTGTSAFLTSTYTLGLTSPQATITFTTKSADTSQAQHEFYLMTFDSGKPKPSAVNVPLAPAGWRYAVWVVDSSFAPKHLFYYGSFMDPTGPDDYTSSGDYPFPGGYRPPLLTDPGAEILVTLEPEWRFGSRPTFPYPFSILRTPLKRFIHYGESIPMQDVTSTSIPDGAFLLKKK